MWRLGGDECWQTKLMIFYTKVDVDDSVLAVEDVPVEEESMAKKVVGGMWVVNKGILADAHSLAILLFYGNKA